MLILLFARFLGFCLVLGFCLLIKYQTEKKKFSFSKIKNILHVIKFHLNKVY